MRIVVIITLLLIAALGISAQRYHSPIFATSTVSRDIVYGAAPDYVGTNTTLLLDIYQPEGDTQKNRALVILVHGGGFTGGGKAGENFQTWGTDLARRGFVAASVEYRLGVESKSDPKLMWEASIRCAQDVRAAVRFMRRHAMEYGIDTSHIYLVGTSAGGLGIVQAAILQDDEVPPNLDATVRNVEGNSGTPGERSTVHGLVVCWGATIDTNFIEPGDPPVFSVHGTKDKTVPFECGPSKFGFDLCGGAAINRRAGNQGIQTDVLLFPGVGHSLDDDPILIDSCYRFFVGHLANLASSPTKVLDLFPSAIPATVYPHPVSSGGDVYVQVPDMLPPHSVVLISVSGTNSNCSTVYQAGSETLLVRLPECTPGMYILQITVNTTIHRIPVAVIGR